MKLFILSVFFLLNSINVYACDRDQAFYKMMAINRANQQMMNKAGTNIELMQKAAKMGVELSEQGQPLADKKYVEVCAAYDRIAKKYNVNLEQASKGMIDMDQIRKDGGKKGGSCSQSDAAIKAVNLTQKLTKRVHSGEAPRSILTEFSNVLNSKTDLLSTDPSAYCSELDNLSKKYQLQ